MQKEKRIRRPHWIERDSKLTGSPDRSGQHNYTVYLESVESGVLESPHQTDSQMYDIVLEGKKPRARNK